VSLSQAVKDDVEGYVCRVSGFAELMTATLHEGIILGDDEVMGVTSFLRTLKEEGKVLKESIENL